MLVSTVMFTGALSAFFRLKVTPSIMSVTLFDAELTSRPLSCIFASRATWVRWLPLAPAWAVAETFRASSPLPAAEISKAFFAPLCDPVSIRRTPLPSLIRLALTPLLLRLMMSRMSLTVAFSGIVISSALRSPSAVKLVPSSFTVPIWMRSVPPPTTASALAKLRVATVWLCASCFTTSEWLPVAPPLLLPLVA